MNELESWRDICGYEGLYQVSNFGNVRSIKGDKIALKKQQIKSNGYLQVQLYKNGLGKHFYVHRLVAFALVHNPNPDKYKDVNHKDENKANNHYSNIELCDRKYNLSYGTRTQRAVISHSKVMKNNPKISKRVICIETGEVFPSTKEVYRLKGISQGNVASCCRGERKIANGLHWKYL